MAAHTKPSDANLYYSIRSLPPLVSEWKAGQPLGLDQVFYVNPHDFLTAYQNDGGADSPQANNSQYNHKRQLLAQYNFGGLPLVSTTERT